MPTSPLTDPLPCKPQLKRNILKPGVKSRVHASKLVPPTSKIPAKTHSKSGLQKPSLTKPATSKPLEQKKLQKKVTSGSLPISKPTTGSQTLTRPNARPSLTLTTKPSFTPAAKKPSEPAARLNLVNPTPPARTKSSPGETCPTPPPRKGPGLNRASTTLKKLPKKAPIKNYETLDHRGSMSSSSSHDSLHTSSREHKIKQRSSLGSKARLSTVKQTIPNDTSGGGGGRITPIKSKMIAPSKLGSTGKLVKSGIRGPGTKKVAKSPRESAVKYKITTKKPLAMQKSHSKESLTTTEPPQCFTRRNSLPVSMLDPAKLTNKSLSNRSSRSKINNSDHSLCSTPSSQISEMLSNSATDLFTEDCEMNNLSILNKSPTHEPNIRSEISITSPDNVPLEPKPRISNLDYNKEYSPLGIVINKMDNLCSKSWDDNNVKDNSYTSPEDNLLTDEQLSDHDLYYHSSELSSGTPSLESFDKEMNNSEKYTPTENLSNYLKEKDVTKDVCLASVLNSPAGESNEVGEPAKKSKIDPLQADKGNQTSPRVARDIDPLSCVDLIKELDNKVVVDENVDTVTNSAPSSANYPRIILTTDKADSEPTTPYAELPSIVPPFLHNPRLSNFKRSQRSITPRRSPGVLIRSVSLPKKHSARLTADEYEQHLKNLESLEYMEPPGNFCIVEGLMSPQPSSYRLEVCSPATPEIMVTEPIVPYHRIRTPKEKHSTVIRRFSESQVFKHHKDKYMKKKQQEEKYNSCPVESVCSVKPDSPNRMNRFVKRVHSLLNPAVRPRPLAVRGDEDGGGFFSSMLNLNYEALARSLHDELPDSPALAHQTLSGERNSFKRSNSLELDDSQTSGIRTTPSDRSDGDSEPVLRETSKAKSITEQLERYGLYGLTQLDKQFDNVRERFNIELESNWQEIVSVEAQNNLTNREKEQQEAIWELFSTEHNYLNNLSTCVQTFLNCLRKLKHEKFLSDINVEDLFLNVELIYEINLKFWKDCLEPCLNQAREDNTPLNPHLITEGYVFEDRFHPYLEYCMKHQERIAYLDSKIKKHPDFKEYITWCETQLRSTTRLGLKDMLVKPFQRITKYPLLIKCILKKTDDDDHNTALKSMLDKVIGFVQSLNRQMQEQEEQRSLKDIMNKIDGYNVFAPPNSTHSNDKIDQILSQYNRLDLLSPVPLLGTQRRFLGESSSKMSTFQDRPFECHLFLFTDMLLVTKGAKKRDKKYTIVKQPLAVDPDKLKVTELEEHQNSLLMVYLNEFGSAIDSFLLQSSSREAHLSFLNSIKEAQDKFREQKTKKLVENDSKSNSNISIDSVSNYSLTSPEQQHLRLGCSITRSSSENYNRRTTESSTSVSRAQSMPASNEKRLHNDTCLASSSASSSETSGSMLSVDSSAKSSSIALSEIKENDCVTSDLSIQNVEDSADENTVISEKCEKYEDNRTDNYITDNLCSDLQYKIDIDKTVLVPHGDNEMTNQDIYNLSSDKL